MSALSVGWPPTIILGDIADILRWFGILELTGSRARCRMNAMSFWSRLSRLGVGVLRRKLVRRKLSMLRMPTNASIEASGDGELPLLFLGEGSVPTLIVSIKGLVLIPIVLARHRKGRFTAGATQMSSVFGRS